MNKIGQTLTNHPKKILLIIFLLTVGLFYYAFLSEQRLIIDFSLEQMFPENDPEKEIYDIALVGHEPSISECLKVLVGSYRPDLKTIINIPYPAGGIAIIFFNIKNWQELDEKTGVLDAFISPNYLRKNEQEN